MNDIETRTDIDLLMRVFYERALTDEVIGYIFTDIAKLDLQIHLPIIGDFWESLLFGTRAYQSHGRNPLLVHRALHLKEPLRPGHFERWLSIFEFAVNEEFSGVRADFIKMRANAIAIQFQRFLNSEDGIARKV
jgi:hemoglobin